MYDDLSVLLVTGALDLTVFLAAWAVASRWLASKRPSRGFRLRWPSHGDLAGIDNADAQLYLTFLSYMTVLFTALSAIGLSIALPLNLSGGDGAAARGGSLAAASVGNVAPTGWRMWAICALTWVYSVATYTCAWRLQVAARGGDQAAPTFEQQLANFTVMMRGLDATIVDPAVVRQRLEKFHAGHLVKCVVVRDSKKLRHADSALRSAEARLDRATAGTSQQSLHEEASYHAKVVQRELRQGVERSAGVCFIIFDSSEHAKDAVWEPRQRALAQEQGWSVFPAPPPSDIAWENLHVTDGSRGLRIAGTSMTLFALCVVVVSPVAVLGKVGPMIDGVQRALDTSATVHAAVASFLPPLIVWMINSVMVPFLIDYMTRFDRFWRKSEQQAAGLHMHTIFLVINSLLIPLTSLHSMGLLMDYMVSTTVDQWSTTLGASFLSSSGSFAIRYLVNCALLSGAFQLLQIPQTMHKFFVSVSAAAPVPGLAPLDPRWVFDFGFWYACSLSICFITLTFAVAVPLILPCGALFFWMKYNIDLHNFELGTYAVDLESHGTVASAAASYLLSAVSLMQFGASGLFAVRGGTDLTAASAPLASCAVVVWAMLLFRDGLAFVLPEHLRHQSGDAPVVYATQKQLMALQTAYVPPCESWGLQSSPCAARYGTV
eukprot:CAMPEP_0170577460 /NCGR_PEP_ID=MMETSP0224-20130122/4938_1 /TAXON_ID=285029 /ORGANISM="Togula jolla, Strain CCCM 725" /LENGTH=660 /DNA_ID=CAMNT_0010900371 /DNA_START=92 /DNA_END=2074 /DNA_ORIENTATION=+